MGPIRNSLTPLCWLLALAGCGTMDREPAPIAPIAEGVLGARAVETGKRSEIRASGRVEGFLLEQTFADLEGSSVRRFEVWDRDGLVVGFVDAFGRAYRLEPFEEPRHVATDELPRAVSAVLSLPVEAAGSLRIVPAAFTSPRASNEPLSAEESSDRAEQERGDRP